MIEELEIILETTSKILQKHVNHSLRQNIVSENTDILNLWNDIEKNGLPKISVKEKFGGFEIPFFSISFHKFNISIFSETIFCLKL